MTLNLSQARRHAQEIVAEVGPDFQYNTGEGADSSCFYEPLSQLRSDGRWTHAPRENDNREFTGCLVGRILDRAGETAHHGGLNDTSVKGLSDKNPGLLADKVVLGYLTKIQDRQDCGIPWADSVNSAEEWLIKNHPSRV